MAFLLPGSLLDFFQGVALTYAWVLLVFALGYRRTRVSRF